MRRIVLSALIAAAALLPAAAAGARSFNFCDVRSEYSLRLEPQTLVWTRDGSARRVEMSRGRLTVDGREISLSNADRERILRIEATVRELVPQVKAIAIDAVAIAFQAIEQVGRLMGSDANLVQRAEEMAKLRIAAERKIEDAFTNNAWSDADFAEVVEDTVEKLVPVVVGDVVTAAVRVALSGDERAAEDLEARAERMEAALEREVEARADALEARAEALCPLIADLDRIDDALELRLEGEIQLDLLRAH